MFYLSLVPLNWNLILNYLNFFLIALINFSKKQESNISNASLTITETLQSSLFSNKLVLFQMPQNLPFMKSNKQKMSATLLEPDPENEDEILAYLIREKLDSMGNELNSDYTSILKPEEEVK